MNIKRLFFGIFIAGLVLVPAFGVSRAEAPAEGDLPAIYLFHGEECPHCQAERAWLEDVKEEFPELEVVELEVWHDKKNRNIFLDVLEDLGVDSPGVPLTIIGDKYSIGFDKAENSGVALREQIDSMRGTEYTLLAEGVLRKAGILSEDIEIKITDEKTGSQINAVDEVKVPFLGKMNIKKMSLPLMTVVLGTLDGFNPCSMWALLILITLVLATGSRKKVWLVGGVFILTSAISYFVFMSAWLNAFVLLEYMVLTRVIVGIIALVAGAISIKGYYTFKPGVCEMSSVEKQAKTTNMIQRVLAPGKTLWAVIIGVIAIAFSVNLVELMCSLGLPVIFTKALTVQGLAAWKYYIYIAWYVFFYMLDDLIVLAVAGFSMKFFNLDSNYSRYSRLIAGILMIALGAIFLLKPELLMMG
jgi:thiol-disulfide isomerase/thioredoxin